MRQKQPESAAASQWLMSSYKSKQEIRTQRHSRAEVMCEDRICSWQFCHQPGNPGATGSWKGQQRVHLRLIVGGITLLWHLDVGLPPSRTLEREREKKKKRFCCFQAPHLLVVFCFRSPGKLLVCAIHVLRGYNQPALIFTKTASSPFIDILPIVAFKPQVLSSTETIWPAKPKIFTLQPYRERSQPHFLEVFNVCVCLVMLRS